MLNFSLGSSFSRKKLLLLGFLFVILLVIPLTVYLVQQQQDLRSRANPTTTLQFTPAEDVATVGAKVDFDVWVSPGENQVNFIKLVVKYDATKLQATPDSFVLDTTTNFSIIQNPTIGADGDQLSVVLSISDPTKVIQEDKKIGTITFEVIGPSEGPTEVSFDSTQIQIRSLSSGDSFTENVFTNGTPAKLTIQDGEITPTPSPSVTPEPTTSPDLSPTPTSTPSGDGATPAENQIPVCSTLTTDRTATGTSPFSLTFTATGSDTDGTISKVTFNFGDGPVEDVTTGGGIGTSSVSLANSHTYNNAGTFTATSMLTDDRGGASDTSACTVTVTVDGGSGTTDGTATPLPDTGPTETIVGAGILGGILFLIGTLLFFAL